MPRKPRATVYNLILFQAGGYPAGSINRDTVLSIQRKLDNTITTEPDRTEIDIWIDSLGGDAHATYKLILDLRERCRMIRAVIPDCAKSAATLLVLGVDEIYMDAGAELGPLDVQIRHPDREEKTISALDVVGSLDYLSEFATGLAITCGAALVKYTGLARSEVLPATLDFTAKFLQPCMDKIDPHVTRRAKYQLQIAERYGAAMLANRKVPEDKMLVGKTAEKLVKRLVTDYPAHDFVISREEASSIGLPIADADKYPRWALTKATHQKFLDTRAPIIEVMKSMPPRPKQAQKSKKVKAGARNAGAR